jgi:hypothetical protein
MRKLSLIVVLLLIVGDSYVWSSSGVVAGPAETSRDAGITLGQESYPAEAKDEIASADGHRLILRDKMGGSGHTNEPTIFMRTPDGKSLSLDFKYVYWETTECKWVNENLFFVRIWWGRHWGTDYIFDADSGTVVYREGFEEPHVPIPAQ